MALALVASAGAIASVPANTSTSLLNVIVPDIFPDAAPVSDYEWQDAGSLLVPRASFAVVVLADGDILITGGRTRDGATASTEIFDSQLRTWKPGPAMTSKRVGHTATLMQDGKVLVVGGDPGSGATKTAELLDPVAMTTVAVPRLALARAGHGAVQLTDGRVLVTGGSDWVTGVWKQAEAFDPVTNKWAPAGAMTHARVFLTMHLLSNGSALAVGGNNEATSELYNPSTNTWSGLAQMGSRRYSLSSTVLADGRVLAAGGLLDGWPVTSAEVYNPATSRWSTVGSMSVARASFSLTKMATGHVLAAGSYSTFGTIPSCELFDPMTGSWSAADPMGRSRGAHGSAVESDGTVLVFGGWSDGSLTASVEAFASGEIEEPRYCQPKDLIPLVLVATEVPGHSTNGFIAQLLAAQAQYEAGNINECLNIMNAFHHHVRAFAQSGHMTVEHAVALYDGYASVVTCLGGTPLPPFLDRIG